MTDIWPVIHLSTNDKITVANAQIAARCGCPGVFLIAMDGSDENIDPAAALIRREVPALKLGVNMLSARPIESVRHSLDQGYDATWSDYAWQPADDIYRLLTGSFVEHKFFAAVAMKGPTHNEPHPGASAREAVVRGFIPMTSGSGTGVTAPFEKIVQLRKAIGPDAPLAMSGVSPPTANRLVPHVTHFLVATCISTDFYTFSEEKLMYLRRRADAGETARV